jgi:hypothetical protein
MIQRRVTVPAPFITAADACEMMPKDNAMLEHFITQNARKCDGAISFSARENRTWCDYEVEAPPSLVSSVVKHLAFHLSGRGFSAEAREFGLTVSWNHQGA